MRRDRGMDLALPEDETGVSSYASDSEIGVNSTVRYA
jgi:hypothetical protein